MNLKLFDILFINVQGINLFLIVRESVYNTRLFASIIAYHNKGQIGELAILTGEVRSLKKSLRMKDEGSEPIKGMGREYYDLSKRVACLVVMGFVLFVWPEGAFASGGLEASSSQGRAGTLSLLAALAIGIAVAVGSVIAFLQLTAKGKATMDFTAHLVDEQGYSSDDADDQGIDSWDDDSVVTDSELEDNPLTDYTIPLTRIISYPELVEAASDVEPRICGVEGEHSGNCYRVLNRRLSFGRDPSQCSILFPYEAGQISRLHCTLSYVEYNGTFVLEDHGSSNGTFLADGQRLEPGKGYELLAGQRFSLSGSEHQFEVRSGD